MKDLIKNEQRYHDMLQEALNIGRIIQGKHVDECKEVVIDVLPKPSSFTEYRRMVICYVLPEDVKDLEFDYQAEALAVVKFVVIKNGVEYASTTNMRVLYSNDENFLQLANVYTEDGIVLNQDGRVGWRDLRDNGKRDWVIYDYFRDEKDSGRILKFRKPEVAGDYSNQTPEVVSNYVI